MEPNGGKKDGQGPARFGGGLKVDGSNLGGGRVSVIKKQEPACSPSGEKNSVRYVRSWGFRWKKAAKKAFWRGVLLTRKKGGSRVKEHQAMLIQEWRKRKSPLGKGICLEEKAPRGDRIVRK